MESVDIQALGRAIHEVLILAVLREGPKHGYQIALDVEEETAGVFAFQHGTLYPILHRLEKRRLIRGRWDEEGRRRKIYELTPKGSAHLEGASREMKTLFLDLIRILEGPRHAHG